MPPTLNVALAGPLACAGRLEDRSLSASKRTARTGTPRAPGDDLPWGDPLSDTGEADGPYRTTAIDAVRPV